MLVFWGVTPCGFKEKYKLFGGSYSFHVQGFSPENQHQVFIKSDGSTTMTCVISHLLLT
jgi:hypothetical protein